MQTQYEPPKPRMLSWNDTKFAVEDQHRHSMHEFVEENGVADEYPALTVALWLGY